MFNGNLDFAKKKKKTLFKWSSLCDNGCSAKYSHPLTPLLCTLCEDHGSAVVAFLAVHILEASNPLFFSQSMNLIVSPKIIAPRENRDIMASQWSVECPAKSTVARDPAQVSIVQSLVEMADERWTTRTGGNTRCFVILL